jgi:DNA-binding LacI/PurR family transcriptional regulator/DNA-binding transcriptional regulator YhcF (GntR family)
MKSSGTTFGRPADSQRNIVHELRAQIVSGDLSPGSRLPTRLEIERRFSAGATTVQRALELLQRDGFIESRGRQGTFVVENPPHLTRYAVVFSLDSAAFSHHRFSTALDSEVRRLRHRRPEFKISEYFGVDGHEDSEDYQRLLREVRTHRIAGLIFTTNPYQVKGTPLLDEPTLPRVAIMLSIEGVAMPMVSLDMDSFFTQALDDLKARGRKKIAFLHPSGFCGWQDRLLPMLEERGLETRPFWWQCVAPKSAQAARFSTHLLMRCEERPDALIISNDNLVEYATAGLVAAGTSVPDEVAVIAHCNFPYPTPSVLPVQRLGFDARRVLQACIESIDRQRNGEDVPNVTTIEAVFEEELSPPLSYAARH